MWEVFQVLIEAGYVDVGHSPTRGQRFNGWFVYQSCSGALRPGSTFGGSVRFAITSTGEDAIADQEDPTATFSPASMFDVVVPTMTLGVPGFQF